MKELVQAVKQWGVDKGLHKVGHLAQAKYTLKETAELLDAYADSDIDAINDAIGDILVTLIVGASNDNDIYNGVVIYLDSTYYWNESNITYLEISGLVEDVLTMIEKEDFSLNLYSKIIYRLLMINKNKNFKFKQSLSLQDCLQLAYNEIKGRTGKLVNGQFIKD